MIESPTPGVVLVDVVIDQAPLVPRLHWRVGTWVKPPLDVALELDGALATIQFVVQDERIDSGYAIELPSGETGVPIFDVGCWPSNRYRDEVAAVTPTRLPDGTLRLQIGHSVTPGHVVRPGDGLAIAVGQDRTLGEIRLGPLPDADWDDIEAFGLASP